MLQLGFVVGSSALPSHFTIMDGDIRRLAMLLVFQMSLFCALESMDIDACIMCLWHWQQMCCLTVAVEGLRRVCARRPKRLWAHDKGMGQPRFFDRNLLALLQKL